MKTMKDIYIKKNTIIHNLNFWTKFICFLLILPICSLLVQPLSLVYMLSLLILLIFVSKVGLKYFLKLTLPYYLIILFTIIILSLIFNENGIKIRVFDGILKSIRYCVLISFGIFFSITTSPLEIPFGMRQVGIPHRFGIIVMVGFRVFPLIINKVKNIIDAQKARGVDFNIIHGKFTNNFKKYFSLLIPIFHSTLKTSIEISDTLISRGYNPYGKIYAPPLKFNFWDFLIGLISCLPLGTFFLFRV